MSRVLPIIFNTEMVRAILDGRKTVTRRKAEFLNGKNPNWTGYVCDGLMLYNRANEPCIKPARYKVGDYLYIREAWAFMPCIECMIDYDGKCLCNNIPITYEDEYSVSEGCFMYKADFPEEEKGCIVWRPSIHMPKKAARIWIKVTDVRVERLQEITEEQAAAEGAIKCYEVIRPDEPEPVICQAEDGGGYYEMGFKAIWNSAVKKSDSDRYGWKANPWVWVIEFERYEKPEVEK